MIEDYAFSSCRDLYSIVLPSSLIKVGYCAFYECYSLVQITNLSGKTFTELPSNPNMEIRTATSDSFQNTITKSGDFISYTVGNRT